MEENETIRIKYKVKNELYFGEFMSYPHVEEFKGKIYIVDEYLNKKVIGKIELHFYNRELIDNDGFNLYDAFDRTMHTINLGNVIIDYETGELSNEVIDLVGDSFNNNILVIQNMILLEEYRNKGIGKKIIDGIEKFNTSKCGYIALQSFPKQHDISMTEGKKYNYSMNSLESNYDIAQQSLNSFYEKCGFVKVQSTNCYIKNIEPI